MTTSRAARRRHYGTHSLNRYQRARDCARAGGWSAKPGTPAFFPSSVQEDQSHLIVNAKPAAFCHCDQDATTKGLE